MVDYPGLGDSPSDPQIVSLDDLYEYLVSNLPEPCNLVAMSMGCGLALRTCIAFPNKIQKLTLIAASGGVDVVALGGCDWRSEWTLRHPTSPRWFVDDHSDFGTDLNRIKVPTLLIFGDADPIAPVAVGQFLEARLPQAKLQVIPGGTHDLEEQCPAILAASIEEFLTNTTLL